MHYQLLVYPKTCGKRVFPAGDYRLRRGCNPGLLPYWYSLFVQGVSSGLSAMKLCLLTKIAEKLDRLRTWRWTTPTI